MDFQKLTLVLLIIALAYFSVAESRQAKPARGKGYRLFKNGRRHMSMDGQGRQYRDSYYRNDKKDDNEIDDYEDLDDEELNNLDLDDNNRIFFFNKFNKFTTTTAAPAITTMTTPSLPPPPPPITTSPITSPVSPVPPPPTSRAQSYSSRYKLLEF